MSDYSIGRQLLSKLVAEFVGTYAIVFFGCGSVAIFGAYQPEAMMFVPIVFGSIVAIMIYTLGHLSGAHFNPAVTIAFACVRHFPARQIPLYIIAQCAGAVVACIALSYCIPDIKTLAPTVPIVPPLKAIVIEIILSFFLMFVVMGVATDTRAEGVMAGAAIGLIVAVDAFVGGPLTGASMNPARSLGPALFDGQMKHLYIYIIGPVIGCVLAGYTYNLIRCQKTHC